MLGHTRKRPTKRNESVESESVFVSAEELFKESFGDRPEWSVMLVGARKRDGLTQKELGEMIGVSQYNISKMERGHRPIGKTIAKRLAEVFKTDYRLFL